jgi:hypothetical protein
VSGATVETAELELSEGVERRAIGRRVVGEMKDRVGQDERVGRRPRHRR